MKKLLQVKKTHLISSQNGGSMLSKRFLLIYAKNKLSLGNSRSRT
jgi:hypothetical protein